MIQIRQRTGLGSDVVHFSASSQLAGVQPRVAGWDSCAGDSEREKAVP